MPGPIPSRESELARPRARKGKEQVPVTKGVARPVRWLEPDPEWHAIAIQLYEATRESGQADYYQQSDVALLWSICEDLSHYKRSTKRSGQMLATIYGAMTSLLVSEGERRRVRIELSEPEGSRKPASVSAIEDYKKTLGVSS